MIRPSVKVSAILLVSFTMALVAVSSEAVAAKKKHLPLRSLAPVISTAPSLSPDEWSDEETALNKKTVDELFTPDITNNMEGRYNRVEAAEQKTMGPEGHAAPWEEQHVYDSKHDVATWTAKEVLSNRLKTILQNADQSSGGMKAITAMKHLTGNEDEAAPAQKSASAKEKTSDAKKGTTEAPLFAKKEEPKIPTRLKTHMNVVKGQGEVRFMNPIVTTAVNVDANKAADNNVAVRMEKDLKALDLKSNVDYGLDKKIVSLNLSKKITDEITANVTSRHATNGEEILGGRRDEEAVNMNYSISF